MKLYQRKLGWIINLITDRIKKQLREKGVKGSIVSDGWRAEREERVKELMEKAVATRRSRAIQFLQEAVADDVPEVVDLVNEFNEIYDAKSITTQ